MANKSLFDFIEKTNSAPPKTEQTFLYPQEVGVLNIPEKIIKIIKPITVSGKTYEVSIE